VNNVGIEDISAAGGGGNDPENGPEPEANGLAGAAGDTCAPNAGALLNEGAEN
jgi:hypothetical protein